MVVIDGFHGFLRWQNTNKGMLSLTASSLRYCFFFRVNNTRKLLSRRVWTEPVHHWNPSRLNSPTCRMPICTPMRVLVRALFDKRQRSHSFEHTENCERFWFFEFFLLTRVSSFRLNHSVPVAVEEAGGPKIPYSTGRIDMEDGSTSDPNDRLPNADYGGRDNNLDGIRKIFYRMGFNDGEIVALLGAHAMGRCHTQDSGFWGPWTFAETTFSNEYFRLLIEER